jgi:hypothetical protein
MTNTVPANATSIFLYSPRQERIRDGGRFPRFSFVGSDGTKTTYTQQILAGLPDTDAKIAEYRKQFPDARIAGYGTDDTQKLASPPPNMTAPAP